MMIPITIPSHYGLAVVARSLATRKPMILEIQCGAIITSIFQPNPHKIHPIARPLGRATGCNLCFDTDLYSASINAVLHKISCYIGRYTGTPLYKPFNICHATHQSKCHQETCTKHTIQKGNINMYSSPKPQQDYCTKKHRKWWIHTFETLPFGLNLME